MPSEIGIVHVIDDDEGFRKLLVFLLQTAGLAVRSHASATDFLEAIVAADLGCIVSDVRMPGMSGIELLRRLKELDIGVPVIVLTGHGDVPLAVEAMKFGAVDFLEKPFDDEVLLAMCVPPCRSVRARPSAKLNGQKSQIASPRFRRASETCSTVSSLATPTSRSPLISASVRARSKSTGPI